MGEEGISPYFVAKTLNKGLLTGFAGCDGEFHHLKSPNLFS